MKNKQREYKIIERIVTIGKGRHDREICNASELDVEMDKFQKETKSKDVDFYFTGCDDNGNTEVTLVNYKRMD